MIPYDDDGDPSQPESWNEALCGLFLERVDEILLKLGLPEVDDDEFALAFSYQDENLSPILFVQELKKGRERDRQRQQERPAADEPRRLQGSQGEDA